MSIDEFYDDARIRISALLRELPAEAHLTPVPACPGWRVRDVVAHLVTTVEDGVEGRLSGPPNEEQTADQVTRCRDVTLNELLERWARSVPEFGRLITERQIWAAAIDVVSHEHDIRGAVGRPGARDTKAIWALSELLLRFETPAPMIIKVEDAHFELGDPPADALALSTTRWEALRWRMGRRSRAQLAAMDWSGDPAPVLDHLVVFGPAAQDLIE